MKKLSAIITSTALVLCACNGNAQQGQDGSNAADNSTNTSETTEQNAEGVLESDSQTEETQEKLSYKVLKALSETPELAERLENFDLLLPDCDDCEELFDGHLGDIETGRLDCFPFTKGGYFVIFRDFDFCDCAHIAYYTYIYRDGRLTKDETLLPDPRIDDYYSNADKFPEEGRKALEMLMTENNYLYDANTGQLNVNFSIWECDEYGSHMPVALKGFDRKDDDPVPTIAYNWNGEKFVRDPQNKPLTEDLAYFEQFSPECKATVAYKVSRLLDSTAHNENCENEHHFSFREEGPDAPSFDVMCFPLTKGGYLVITGKNAQYGLHKYTAYTYDGGDLKPSGFKLPDCPLADLLDDEKSKGHEADIEKLEAFFAKDPSLVREYHLNAEEQKLEINYNLDYDIEEEIGNEKYNELYNIGKWDKRPTYKWNGEDFVKQ